MPVNTVTPKSVVLGEAPPRRASLSGRLGRFFGLERDGAEAGADDDDDDDGDVAALKLPDPKDRAAFDAFCEPVIAQECLNVLARMRELDAASEHLAARADELDAAVRVPSLREHGERTPRAEAEARRDEAVRRLEAVRQYARAFERKWGLGDHAHRSHHLHLKFSGKPWWKRALVRCANLFGCCLSELTDEERLERIVRAKVRRDVAQACAWDEELSELEGLSLIHI